MHARRGAMVAYGICDRHEGAQVSKIQLMLSGYR
jgi:hypothetical protein